ncbi:MAG: DHH family phosphoesterase, partial [Gemmatimonas sp.]
MTAVFSGTTKLTPDVSEVGPARTAAVHALHALFKPGMKIALSTHINADGDGCGSEVGMAHLLAQLGCDVRIVNPTPWPAMF